jgi:hypothetical protein
MAAYLNSSKGGAEYEKLLGTPGMGMAFADDMSLAHIYAVVLIVVALAWFQLRRKR